MNTITIIAIVILAILLTIASMGYIFYSLIKRYFDNEQKKALLELKINNQKEALKIVNPIRLQAYERMALFLERISPNSLIMRCYQPGMSLQLLQGVMTKNIRSEWEHNLSQQVYISSEAWNRIREAKEEMINLINSTAANMNPEADPTSLAGAIFQSVAGGHIPTDEALEFLKKEIQEHFE